MLPKGGEARQVFVTLMETHCPTIRPGKRARKDLSAQNRADSSHIQGTQSATLRGSTGAGHHGPGSFLDARRRAGLFTE